MFSENKFCDACVKGKQTRSSFKVMKQLNCLVVQIRFDHGTEFGKCET